MKVRISDTYEDMSEAAAQLVIEQVRRKPDWFWDWLPGVRRFCYIRSWERRIKPGSLIFLRCGRSIWMNILACRQSIRRVIIIS